MRQMFKQGGGVIHLMIAVPIGAALYLRVPFENGNDVLQLILLQKPYLFYSIKWAYLAMLFTTPYIATSLLFSVAFILLPRQGQVHTGAKLPQYPEVASRNNLFVVVGEVHHAKRQEPAE